MKAAEQFRSATHVCEDAHDSEIAPEEKHRLGPGARAIKAAEQFRSATHLCGDAHDSEIVPAERRRLACASFLFVQVAEHLERGKALTPDIVVHCFKANALISDKRTRRKIESLLSEAMRR